MDIEQYWQEFLANTNRPTSLRYYECFSFGSTAQMAESLLQLVLQGTKRATTSLYEAYLADNQPLPKVGDMSIVTDHEGAPRCIIQTTTVTILPYSEVTYEICKREGEDDTLESWQEGHWKFLCLDAKDHGLEFTKDSKLVFEDFSVIY